MKEYINGKIVMTYEHEISAFSEEIKSKMSPYDYEVDIEIDTLHLGYHRSEMFYSWTASSEKEKFSCSVRGSREPTFHYIDDTKDSKFYGINILECSRLFEVMEDFIDIVYAIYEREISESGKYLNLSEEARCELVSKYLVDLINPYQ